MKKYINVKVDLAEKPDEHCFSAKLDRLSVELPDEQWGKTADAFVLGLKGYVDGFLKNLPATKVPDDQ